MYSKSPVSGLFLICEKVGGYMTVEVGILIAVGTFVITYLTFNRNRDKDVKSDASRNAVIETKLDNIGSSVESIRIDLKANEKRWEKTEKDVARVDKDVARVEEIAKSAHKRIDSIENKEEK